MNENRVTLEMINNTIVSEHYFTALDGALHPESVSVYKPNHIVPKSIEALELVTFCVLVLDNGYTVTGQSACVDPDNFDAQLGRDIARRNAVDAIWPLLGFQLKTRLAAAGSAVGDEVSGD